MGKELLDEGVVALVDAAVIREFNSYLCIQPWLGVSLDWRAMPPHESFREQGRSGEAALTPARAASGSQGSNSLRVLGANVVSNGSEQCLAVEAMWRRSSLHVPLPQPYGHGTRARAQPCVTGEPERGRAPERESRSFCHVRELAIVHYRWSSTVRHRDRYRGSCIASIELALVYLEVREVPGRGYFWEERGETCVDSGESGEALAGSSSFTWVAAAIGRSWLVAPGGGVAQPSAHRWMEDAAA